MFFFFQMKRNQPLSYNTKISKSQQKHNMKQNKQMPLKKRAQPRKQKQKEKKNSTKAILMKTEHWTCAPRGNKAAIQS